MSEESERSPRDRSGRNQPARLPDPGRRRGLRRGRRGRGRRHPGLPEAEGALRAADRLPRRQPLDYPEGTVRFNREQRAYVIGGAGGVYALSAVCTHLGCITRYLSDENAIACPCHGSRFDLEGNVVHGPAPRPLPWLEVTPDAAGNLVVDTSVVIPHGKVLRA